MKRAGGGRRDGHGVGVVRAADRRAGRAGGDDRPEVGGALAGADHRAGVDRDRLSRGRRWRSPPRSAPARRSRRPRRRARRACRRRRSRWCSSTRPGRRRSAPRTAECRRCRRVVGKALAVACSSRAHLGRRHRRLDREDQAGGAGHERRREAGAERCARRSCRCRSRRRRRPPASCVPEFDVVMIGYRHGSPSLIRTQLPPGALIAISGPRSEKPTLSPTWRRPPTAMIPGQLAGVLTAWPAVLPAEATTTTLAAVMPGHRVAVRLAARAGAAEAHADDLGRVGDWPAARALASSVAL